MTVERLIELLKKADPKLEVFGCYDSYCCICDLEEESVILVDHEYYERESMDKLTTKAVYIECNIGSFDYHFNNLNNKYSITGTMMKDL